MRSDFHDAHHRHWQDAELLYQEQRFANADHLYGMAAECGLKRLMLEFGMLFDVQKDRPVKGADATHVDALWSRYESYRSGHHNGTNYGLPSVNPFQDWSAGQRYAGQGNFSAANVTPHRDGARKVSSLIHRARLEGLI